MGTIKGTSGILSSSRGMGVRGSGGKRPPSSKNWQLSDLGMVVKGGPPQTMLRLPGMEAYRENHQMVLGLTIPQETRKRKALLKVLRENLGPEDYQVTGTGIIMVKAGAQMTSFRVVEAVNSLTDLGISLLGGFENALWLNNSMRRELAKRGITKFLIKELVGASWKYHDVWTRQTALISSLGENELLGIVVKRPEES